MEAPVSGVRAIGVAQALPTASGPGPSTTGREKLGRPFTHWSLRELSPILDRHLELPPAMASSSVTGRLTHYISPDIGRPAIRFPPPCWCAP